ncbi:MAG: response regulator [Candidatus Heimdallarchaeota archaeon]|nr:response regulator [Candidatus Heimdallarchaeota archaeon]
MNDLSSTLRNIQQGLLTVEEISDLGQLIHQEIQKLIPFTCHLSLAEVHLSNSEINHSIIYRSKEIDHFFPPTEFVEVYEQIKNKFLNLLMDKGLTFYYPGIPEIGMKFTPEEEEYLIKYDPYRSLSIPYTGVGNKVLGYMVVWWDYVNPPFELSDELIERLEFLTSYVGIAIQSFRRGLSRARIQNRYDELFNNSRDLFYTRTEDGIILTANPAMSEILEIELEELIGMNVHDMPAAPTHFVRREDIDTYNQTLTNLENKEDLNTYDHAKKIYWTTKSGKTKVLLSTVWTTEEDGELLFHVIARDVTEAEELDSTKMRNQRLEELGLLAGGIAHDFNNFLQSIVGQTFFIDELVADLHIQKDVDESTQLIRDAVESAARITRKLLTYSSGGLPLFEVLDLTKLLRESSSLFTSGQGLELRGINELPQAYVIADSGLLSQVLSNLLVNAAQELESVEQPWIRIGLVDENNSWKIEIEDNGGGIPDFIQGKIFQPYFSTRTRGSGLGLPTTQSILTKHNSSLHFNTQLGKGTTFYFSLPSAPAPIIIEPIEIEDVTARRILLLEDDVLIAKSLKRLLNRLGHTVVTVHRGEDLLLKYSPELFDLILMDLTIQGGMDGGIAFKHLQEKYTDIKAIVMSGYSDSDLMSNFEKYGFVGRLAKPFSKNQLLTVISNVFNNGK